ncbi:MAG: phosphoribosylformylglycinamidine synthase I [Nanoarchaeota archaeon]|nr:phosphoribosylformylglycinamidine synthase I [Nanoarchaeota archaeon]
MKATGKKLKVGIIRFPASNCDFDTLNFFQRFGHHAEFVWYKETKPLRYNLIVLPGGFAFGDRLYAKATRTYQIDPGALALRSPILRPIRRAAKEGVPILGICNGFQILVKAGLLPGKLLQNKAKKFFCDNVKCKLVGNSFFEDKTILGKTLTVPVAHGYGRYSVSKREEKTLVQNKQVFLKYAGPNPNGSTGNIAGVHNKEKTIFGIMPHPERSPDARYFMRAIEKYVEAN